MFAPRASPNCFNLRINLLARFDVRCYFVYERINKRFVANCHKLICTRGIQFIFLEIRLPATNLDLWIIALINSQWSIQNPPNCVCRYVHVDDKFDDCVSCNWNILPLLGNRKIPILRFWSKEFSKVTISSIEYQWY